MTLELWLEQHPYLRPIVELDAVIQRAMDQVRLPAPPIPRWSDYAADFGSGVPILDSPNVSFELDVIEGVSFQVAQLVASKPLRIDIRLQMEDSGFSEYLCTTVFARYVLPVVSAFDAWRDEERWLRNYCPMCGSPPAMAQLRGVDPGRVRFLSCGLCRSRWRYRRIGCPFCDNQNEHALPVLVLSSEKQLRIDYCSECLGYLKTYNGESHEEVFLADWTSLHIDFAAQHRGLKRMAASRYSLPS